MLFLEENILLVLIIPFSLFVFSFRPSPNSLRNIFSKSVLMQLSVYKNDTSNILSYRLLLISLILFILSLGRPVVHEQMPSKEKGLSPLVIALDMSKSMYAKDIYPNRLNFAKEKIKAFLSLGRTMRVGLILFSKDAYVAYPMSEDTEALASVIDNFNFKKSFKPESNIFACIEGSAYLLRNYKTKNILLLSDGAQSDDFSEEISYLKKHHIVLHAIAVATLKGALVSKTSSHVSVLNPSLKRLSQESGGEYQDFSIGQKDINIIFSKMKKDTYFKAKSSEHKSYIELFYYPLGLGIFILFFVFSSFKILIKKTNNFLLILFISFFFTQTNTEAGLFDFLRIKEAKQAYKEKDYVTSVTLYQKLEASKELNYNLATSLYKAGEYKKSLKIYKKALSKDLSLNAKIYHNIGNVYVRLSKYKLAKKYYKKAIELSKNTRSIENLERVNQALKDMQKKGQKDKIKRILKQIAIEKKDFEEPPSSDYEVRLEHLVLSDEERWMKILQGQSSLVFLQKIPTKRISKNASVPW